MTIAPETLKELIKNAIKLIIDSKDFKIILIDSAGNVISDISLSTLRDALKGANNKDFSTLEADVEDIKGALDSVGTDKIRTSIVDALPESPFNLSKVAGTALTGRDWSSDFEKLQNLDVLLSTRAPKDEGETIEICKDADITGSVTTQLRNFKRWTLYLKVAGAIDITIELSPDGGNTWFTIPESPISFSGAGDDVIEFGYDATHIKLTGSNTNAVTAIIRGVY